MPEPEKLQEKSAGPGREPGRAAEHAPDPPLLQLQRLAGNRAVSRLLSGLAVEVAGDDEAGESRADRAAERAAAGLDARSALGPPDGGGSRTVLAPDLAASIGALEGRGRPLGGPVRATMESAYGRSFADVGVHADATAGRLSRSLGAAAFTTGRDVFLDPSLVAPGSRAGTHVLAHELAHVSEGRSAGPALVQRFSISKLFKMMGGASGSKAGAKDGGAKDSGGKDGSSEEAQAKDPDAPDKAPDTPASAELADAIEYESRLGRYLFNHPRANYAAARIIDRMITVLIGEFDQHDKGQQEQIAATFGANRKKTLGEQQASAGQVGTTFEPVWAALREGNLRERMTAIMNAMFGPFKATIMKIIDDSAWESAQAKGLNVTKLKRRKNQLKFNVGARDLYRDPGNPLDRKNFSTWENTGTTRDAVEQTSARKVGDLEAGPHPIGLSEREKDFQFPDRDGEDMADEKLKWQEGGTYWKMRSDNKWVSKVRSDLKMPVIAGPSGTTLRFFQLWEFLSKPVEAADMRAAVLGWMLSSNDHTFHEMMMTAADYGLPYTPGPRAYRNVAPLTEPEVRANVAVERTFPDEKAFARKVAAKGLILGTDDQKAQVDDIDYHGGLGLTEVEKTILQTLVLYTDENPSAYKFMNNAFGGGLVTPKFMKFIMEDTHLKPKYQANQFNIKNLIDEAKEVSFHAASALKGNAISTYKGPVFRGQKAFTTAWMTPGKVVKQNKFLSSSKDRGTAERFANKGMGFRKVVIEMTSNTGRSVEEFSLVGGEDEILFAPGSQFRIDTAPTKDSSGFYVTRWTDVSTVEEQKTAFTPEKLKNFDFDESAYDAPQVPDTTGGTGPVDDHSAPVDVKAVALKAFEQADGFGQMIETFYPFLEKLPTVLSEEQLKSLDDDTKFAILKLVGTDAESINYAINTAYGIPHKPGLFKDPPTGPTVDNTGPTAVPKGPVGEEKLTPEEITDLVENGPVGRKVVTLPVDLLTKQGVVVAGTDIMITPVIVGGMVRIDVAHDGYRLVSPMALYEATRDLIPEWGG